jgi:hypothetical protein
MEPGFIRPAVNFCSPARAGNTLRNDLDTVRAFHLSPVNMGRNEVSAITGATIEIKQVSSR